MTRRYEVTGFDPEQKVHVRERFTKLNCAMKEAKRLQSADVFDFSEKKTLMMKGRVINGR